MTWVAIVVGLAFGLGIIGTLVVVERLLFRPLREEHLLAMGKVHERLRAAQTDVALVKALRAGDLDVKDLVEVGVLEVDRLESKGGVVSNLLHPPGQHLILESLGPRFVPALYKREPPVRALDPGDEVWIRLDAVSHDEKGSPVAYKDAPTTQSQTVGHTARLRVFEDGSLELGVHPNETRVAGARVGQPQFWRPIARVVQLGEETKA